MVLRFFRTPALSPSAERRTCVEAEDRLGRRLGGLKTETCFYVEIAPSRFDPKHLPVLTWLLSETFEPDSFGSTSFLAGCETILEVGPRLTFETPFSSNAVAICRKCGVGSVERLEHSVRFGLNAALSDAECEAFMRPLHDRMTQERYREPRESFQSTAKPEPVRTIPLLTEGMAALERANRELGLAMDRQDLEIWFDLFVNVLKRNPTDVELFQIGQANSEHCRHGWFRGRHVIDGRELPESPMDIVRATLRANPQGSVIGFHDNSSAIQGRRVDLLVPSHPSKPSRYRWEWGVTLHPTLTAETHNHPSGIEPFEGAGTGGGGRLRDNQMVGRGGVPIVGGAGYCTGNLLIPGYDLPWEQGSWPHPGNLASPLDIMVRASDGASYYGNCFGEPVVYGFARTFGMNLPDGYRSWFKPIMYSAGAGALRAEHVEKGEPKKGMLIILLGGPGFRIGVGGGSASSMVAGTNAQELDFASVQRSNPEMENRMGRVVTACINLGKKNPIVSAHDLGAGGTCNAVPEIANPAGARIDFRTIPAADPTLSVREGWGSEAQERDVVLIWADRLTDIADICLRENCPLAVIGEITGDGELVLYDASDGTTPVRLPLERILGKLPQKTFTHVRTEPALRPLVLPKDLTVKGALERVLRLLSVASKHWLTNKADRSVTGLVSQQQCVGPFHVPVADFASRANSHFGLSGAVMSLGEQPIKGLLNPSAMARLAVAEAVLNMSGALTDGLDLVKCSGNWMWPAKFDGEGPKLIDAALAAQATMLELGLAIDGGKDSLSMAAKALAPDGTEAVVKAPGQFVVAAYVTTPDVRIKATPDLKRSGNTLVWIDLCFGKARLGGSALAQVFGQLGDVPPDVDNVPALKETFKAVQELVRTGAVASVHDVSDGGVITTLLEMAFAGGFGLSVKLTGNQSAISVLFAEEPGVVLEINRDCMVAAIERLAELPMAVIGHVGEANGTVSIRYNGSPVLREPVSGLKAIWEETGNRLERLQADPGCIAQQEEAGRTLTAPPYHVTFEQTSSFEVRVPANNPRVALVREEGTNGDREMAAALAMAKFEVWDVTISDLVSGAIGLEGFRGVVFPGGFSFGDVLDSAKGWAGAIRFNPKVAEEFSRFLSRTDTFSLGVCNGCQLMALLGWVPGYNLKEAQQPRFIRNESGRFESRFVTVRIEDSPAIMLKGMAGSVLGIWVAHGEGRLHVPHEKTLLKIIRSKQAPIRYVGPNGEPTTGYPYNPNGSPYGIAALCSADGRHLGMMPHSERTVLPWQWPWAPQEWYAHWEEIGDTPWLKMFENAREWCS